LSVAAFIEAGCDSCEKKPESSPSTAVSATSPTKDAAAALPMTDAGTTEAATGDAGLKHDMGNCPTAVAGAEVAVKDVDGGIEVAVTAKDEAATNAIRERVKKITEAVLKDAGGSAKHDHSGAGGGTTGRCTIIMRNTKLTAADIPNGSKVTVLPNDKTELDWLRRETKERDKEAKSTGAEGAGAQRMANCPSAVAGTKTSVKDSKEGVIVTVTGPADAVAEIRSRAKHSAEIAKKGEPAKVEHSGGGTGGGGLGRCPIVVEGDTTVDVKDITGGVEVEVKTKKDVAELQKETKLRAAGFQK
jgi:hypothetical protein